MYWAQLFWFFNNDWFCKASKEFVRLYSKELWESEHIENLVIFYSINPEHYNER